MPKPKSGNIRVNVLMHPKVLQALRLLADKRGASYSELIRTACRQYVLAELKTSSNEAEQAPSASE